MGSSFRKLETEIMYPGLMANQMIKLKPYKLFKTTEEYLLATPEDPKPNILGIYYHGNAENSFESVPLV